ncbi:MAG: hypothetical protein ICV55_05885 [Coleofasciculus sp. C3-bin4]|nr:hypothetical protein [Coleofasciculus sp. C3-bin4]
MGKRLSGAMKIGEKVGEKGDKPFIAARVPKGLYEALESHSEATGESKTEAIINALGAYLGWTNDKAEQISISDRLSLLENRVDQLEQVIKEPRQTSLLDIQPETLTELSPKPEPIKTVKPSPPTTVINTDNESDNRTTDINSNENADSSNEKLWMTMREAYDQYGLPSGVSYETFRKMKPEQLMERFNLETDLSRRKEKGYNSKWLKKAN